MASKPVSLNTGPGGLSHVTLRHAAGVAKADIYLFGAHVTSWVAASGREMLYLSPTAHLDGTKAIRGGIPVCFPQFGKHGPLKQHGFARTATWRIEDEDAAMSSTTPTVTLAMSETPDTVASDWPFRFKAMLTFAILDDGNLSIKMAVENRDERVFDFSTALHSYFTVDNLDDSRVPGLSGLTYADNANAGAEEKDKEPFVSFGKEVDRLYYGAPDEIELASAHLKLMKTNYPDAVVWNCYKEKAAALSDLPDDGWLRYVCIEPARVREKAVVTPGATWAGRLILKETAS